MSISDCAGLAKASDTKDCGATGGVADADSAVFGAPVMVGTLPSWVSATTVSSN